MRSSWWYEWRMPLTDLVCRKTKPGPKLVKLSDSGGLQLWVYPNGSKFWRVAYRFANKQKLLSIGKYPTVSLLDARFERDKAKIMLRDGGDPAHAKRIARMEREFPGDSFEIVAKEYLDKLRREGRADATMKKNEWLLSFALPVLGPMSVGAVRPIDVLAVLRTVERRGRYETARRLRAEIGAVFRYAAATARSANDPTVALKGALTKPTVRHRAAVTESKGFGAMLRAIDGYSGQPLTRAALQLMALLFPRPFELRTACWTEFDLDGAVWTVPAERMKMRRPHSVPLCRQALAVLVKLEAVARPGPLVFPSLHSIHRPMSENTMNAALRRLGYSEDEATAHGFRASASTLLNESGLWNPDAIERQLAHEDEDEIRAVYARGKYWDERVGMMAWWGDHLDRLRTVGGVLPITGAVA
jgi:integrase